MPGNIVAWGDNDYGQTNVPLGKDFIAIASGYNHSLALRADGSLAGWGDGQTSPPAGNNFVFIACGQYHSLALHSDGTIRAWGRNSDGQLNAPAGSFIAVAGGGYRHQTVPLPGGVGTTIIKRLHLTVRLPLLLVVILTV